MGGSTDFKKLGSIELEAKLQALKKTHAMGSFCDLEGEEESSDSDGTSSDTDGGHAGGT